MRCMRVPLALAAAAARPFLRLPHPAHSRCCAVRGRLGSTDLQRMPSEGPLSWHSGAHPPPLLSPGRVTISDDYGPNVAAGGWSSPPPPPASAPRRDSHESAAGRPEQLADVGRSEPALRGLNDYASTGSGRRIRPKHGIRSHYMCQSPAHGPGIYCLT